MAGISSDGTVKNDPNQTLEQIPNIQSFALYLERKGRSKYTIRGYTINLRTLAKTADLTKPNEVETAVARYTKQNGEPCTNNYKVKLLDTYHAFLKWSQPSIQWERPHYTKEEKAIIPPTDQKAKLLIGSAKGTLSLKLDISYKTGLRPIEVVGEKGLLVKDIDLEQKRITARITKGCNARPPITIDAELATRLRTYIIKNDLQPEDRLFKGSKDRYTNAFIKFKKRLAKKLSDPSIRNIRLYDFRHAYTTKQLMKTQNAETVRIIMGHKSLNTTQKYLHLLNFEEGEWEVEGTTDKKRVEELLLLNYKYELTTPDGTMMFRKRK